MRVLRSGRTRVTVSGARMNRRKEIDQLLLALRKEAAELLPIVLCLLNTGMRKGEALALTWVDFERREIRIWPSDQWQPKDKEPREVPISDDLLPYLERARLSEKCVFPSSTGERWKCWPKNQFDRARGKAKLEGGPHALRHTFASHFLAKQPDLGLLAEILGHSEEAVTRLYQHMLPERLARARNVVSIGMPQGQRGVGQALFDHVRSWAGTALPATAMITLPREDLEAWVLAAKTNRKSVEGIDRPADVLVRMGLLAVENGKPLKTDEQYKEFAPAVARLAKDKRRVREVRELERTVDNLRRTARAPRAK
jgi:hypothetical protein